jgi:hypothetical protein
MNTGNSITRNSVVSSDLTPVKTRWERVNWSTLRRFTFHISSNGSLAINEVSKGIMACLGTKMPWVSHLSPFSGKQSSVINVSQDRSKEILSRLNSEQRALLVSWQRAAQTNQLPHVHRLLDKITSELEIILKTVENPSDLRDCFVVLKEEIEEQQKEHLEGLKKAVSPTDLQICGYLFLQRANTLEELFNLYKSEINGKQTF